MHRLEDRSRVEGPSHTRANHRTLITHPLLKPADMRGRGFRMPIITITTTVKTVHEVPEGLTIEQIRHQALPFLS